jgi:hypothetical protein
MIKLIKVHTLVRTITFSSSSIVIPASALTQSANARSGKSEEKRDDFIFFVDGKKFLPQIAKKLMRIFEAKNLL